MMRKEKLVEEGERLLSEAKKYLREKVIDLVCDEGIPLLGEIAIDGKLGVGMYSFAMVGGVVFSLGVNLQGVRFLIISNDKLLETIPFEKGKAMREIYKYILKYGKKE